LPEADGPSIAMMSGVFTLYLGPDSVRPSRRAL